MQRWDWALVAMLAGGPSAPASHRDREAWELRPLGARNAETAAGLDCARGLIRLTLEAGTTRRRCLPTGDRLFPGPYRPALEGPQASLASLPDPFRPGDAFFFRGQELAEPAWNKFEGPRDKPGPVSSRHRRKSLDWLRSGRNEAFRRRSGLRAEAELPSAEPSLTPDQRTHVVRSCQESLTNVARHARGSGVRLIVQDGGGLLMTIADDGVGLAGRRRIRWESRA